MDRVARIRPDAGHTVAELLVSISILLVVLSMVYFAMEAIEVSAKVTERQSMFAQEIANPMHGMDKVLSANKAIENASGFVSDAYTLTTRTSVIRSENAFQRYVYSANEDGTLTESVYRQDLGSNTSTLLRTRTWSENNANRERGPMFQYLDADGQPTSATSALSVVVTVWVQNDGQYLSGQRQIFFRNR
jgi:hypothetical protein